MTVQTGRITLTYSSSPNLRYNAFHNIKNDYHFIVKKIESIDSLSIGDKVIDTSGVFQHVEVRVIELFEEYVFVYYRGSIFFSPNWYGVPYSMLKPSQKKNEL